MIAPIRLALAGAGLVAAIAAGSSRASGLLAFGATTVGTPLLVIADPRARFFSVPEQPPEAPPAATELRSLERRGNLRLFLERGTSRVLSRRRAGGTV